MQLQRDVLFSISNEFSTVKFNESKTSSSVDDEEAVSTAQAFVSKNNFQEFLNPGVGRAIGVGVVRSTENGVFAETVCIMVIKSPYEEKVTDFGKIAYSKHFQPLRK